MRSRQAQLRLREPFIEIPVLDTDRERLLPSRPESGWHYRSRREAGRGSERGRKAKQAWAASGVIGYQRWAPFRRDHRKTVPGSLAPGWSATPKHAKFVAGVVAPFSLDLRSLKPGESKRGDNPWGENNPSRIVPLSLGSAITHSPGPGKVGYSISS